MDTVHLSQKHLSARWRVAEATLERWRSDGLGPQYLKINGRVLYRLSEIQEFENASLRGVATYSSQEGHPQS